MKQLSMTVGLLLGVLSFGPAAGATTWSLWDYWETASSSLGGAANPHTCTAEILGVEGTYIRHYRRGTCSSKARYSVVKGTDALPGGPWASEDHILDTGWLFITREETTSAGGIFSSCGGVPGQARVFRDSTSLQVGLQAMKTWANGYVTFTQAPYRLDYWNSLVCSYGSPDCVAGPFSGGFVEQGHLGYQWNWLYDCRAGRPCTSTSYPVEVIFKADHWGGTPNVSSVKEEYWFGRWQDPVAGGTWKSLGLVQWQCTDFAGAGRCGGMNSRLSSNRYLVDCKANAICNVCP